MGEGGKPWLQVSADLRRWFFVITPTPSSSAALTGLLDQVDVVDERPDVAGYDRECGTGHACSFGQRWSDDVDVELGHNGCGTRDDVLSRDLEDVT